MSIAKPGRELLQRRLSVARGQKDYNLVLTLLDDILAGNPDAVEFRLMKTHLLARKGDITLDGYCDIVSAILVRLQESPVLSLSEGRKLLRGIQFACSGGTRKRLLMRLLSLCETAVGGGDGRQRGMLVLQAGVCLALQDYDLFGRTVAALSAMEKRTAQVSVLERVAAKLQDPAFPNYRGRKVFGIGLSRTGTTSLNSALEILGFDALHWLNPHTQTVIDNPDFPLFDAFSDISVSYQFELLYRAYPESCFVYTTRPKATWIESVQAHYFNLSRIEYPQQLAERDMFLRFGGTAALAEQNLYVRHGSWSAAYDHYSERVAQFMRDADSQRFLELRLTEGQAWEELCAFLGKAIPDTPFPNLNKRPRPRNVQ